MCFGLFGSWFLGRSFLGFFPFMGLWMGLWGFLFIFLVVVGIVALVKWVYRESSSK
jgi:hypothetical protein